MHRPRPPRPDAIRASAAPYVSSFGVERRRSCAPPNERSCLGHRETVFGLALVRARSGGGGRRGRSGGGAAQATTTTTTTTKKRSYLFLATASQDSTIRIWDAEKNRLVGTLKGHGPEHECLRAAWSPVPAPLDGTSKTVTAKAKAFWRRSNKSGGGKSKGKEDDDVYEDKEVHLLPLLASAGADGIVKVWRFQSSASNAAASAVGTAAGGKWECVCTIDHGPLREEILSPPSRGKRGGWRDFDDDDDDERRRRRRRRRRTQGGENTSGKREGGTRDDNDDDDNGSEPSDGSDGGGGGKREESEEEENGTGSDPPQVYALQFIRGWGRRASSNSAAAAVAVAAGKRNSEEGEDVLLSSSDDLVHLWRPVVVVDDDDDDDDDDRAATDAEPIQLERYLTLRFGHVGEGGSAGVGMFVHHGTSQWREDGAQGRIFPDGRAGAVRQDVDDDIDFDGDGNNYDDDNNKEEEKDEEEGANRRRAFGGLERNPENLVYVFDASYCANRSLLAVALSDGTVRIIDSLVEGDLFSTAAAVAVLDLRPWRTHVTGLGWDSSGRRIACAVATGHVVLWDVGERGGDGSFSNNAYRAVLQGGHDPGRPIFGVLYCGVGTSSSSSSSSSQELLLSWGVDGKLCLWDAWSVGYVCAPLAVLVDKGPDFPIYAVDVLETRSVGDDIDDDDNDDDIDGEGEFRTTIAVGGGRDGGFLGVPVFLYDVVYKK